MTWVITLPNDGQTETVVVKWLGCAKSWVTLCNLRARNYHGSDKAKQIRYFHVTKHIIPSVISALWNTHESSNSHHPEPAFFYLNSASLAWAETPTTYIKGKGANPFFKSFPRFFESDLLITYYSLFRQHHTLCFCHCGGRLSVESNDD